MRDKSKNKMITPETPETRSQREDERPDRSLVRRVLTKVRRPDTKSSA